MLRELKQKYKKNKVLLIFGLASSLAVIGLLIFKLTAGRLYQALFCFLTLLIFQIPNLSEKLLKVHIPAGLEIIIIMFALAANICGEIFGIYIKLPYWDSYLHIIWGFCGGAVGYGLMAILNGGEGSQKSPKHEKKRQVRWFTALFCLCFSVTTGVLWEFIEFFMDSVFRTDMQKDTYVNLVSSVLLNPRGENSAVKTYINSVIINGKQWKGYIDIGLTDTMNDLLVNFSGAVLFSLCAAFCSRDKKLWRIIAGLIPTAADNKKK